MFTHMWTNKHQLPLYQRMTTPTQLINGQTVHEFLQEKGLLKGLTDEALASTHSTHLADKQQAQNESAKDTGCAGHFFNCSKKMTRKLWPEIKRNDPARIRQMQEAYLNSPKSNSTGL
jgi:hypothetical protein